MRKDYALYKGDRFIDLGSKRYLANLLNVKVGTITFYATPTYRKRANKNNNGLIVIKIKE